MSDQPTPDAIAPRDLMPITEQFAIARREAERRGWVITDLSFDSRGLHLHVNMREGHVRWFPSLYERIVARFGPR